MTSSTEITGWSMLEKARPLLCTRCNREAFLEICARMRVDPTDAEKYWEDFHSGGLALPRAVREWCIEHVIGLSNE